jgi:RNA polymerase sigma factor (sigma-70 family)
MKEEQEGVASFRTTHWSMVMMAAQSQAPGGHEALAELCRLYWYPLYVFARRRGHSPDYAEDLTQGFFLHLLEHKALINVDRLKGKFRSFLLASFQNHLSTEAARARTLKRGGSYEIVSLDLDTAESRYQKEPTDYLTPEKIFDARWAMTLLERTMSLLREEYAAQGKATTFEALKIFLQTGGTESAPTYDEVAKLLNVPLPSAKTLIHRLRKRYTAMLREEVGRTVSDPEEVDGEIHALINALIASEGRIS